MEKQKIIFITGGARSGKSTFAENYAAKLANTNGGLLYYIATSKPSDNEMIDRISRHQKQRQASGYDWKSIECPVDLHAIADSFHLEDIVLLDCLTILLSNELFRDYPTKAVIEQKNFQKKIMQSILTGLNRIQKRSKAFLIVSNEVLNEYVMDDLSVHIYSRLLGTLHRSIVKMAKEAYLVEAGIPILMKGVCPNEGDYDSRNGIQCW